MLTNTGPMGQTTREPDHARRSASSPFWTTWNKPRALALLLVVSAAAAMDEWRLPRCNERDKQLHFAGGAIVGACTRAVAERFVPQWPEWGKQALAIGTAALVGAAKEALDSRQPDRHDSSCADFLATTAGGAAGSLTVALTFRWTW